MRRISFLLNIPLNTLILSLILITRRGIFSLVDEQIHNLVFNLLLVYLVSGK